MRGTLYGVGVGPGDPELMTQKAIRRIEKCKYIAVAGRHKEETTAYQIVKQAMPEIDEKTFLEIHMPMTKEDGTLEEFHRQAEETVRTYLDKGEDVAFLILGDPTIYSTYMYVHRRIKEKGYPTEIINGVTSFCAVSARLNEGLVQKDQMLHIIPSSYPIEDAMQFPGTKVLMKTGRQMSVVKQQLMDLGCNAKMVENCGMPNEHIYYSVEEIPDKTGYYSLIIVR